MYKNNKFLEGENFETNNNPIVLRTELKLN